MNSENITDQLSLYKSLSASTKGKSPNFKANILPFFCLKVKIDLSILAVSFIR